MTPDNCSCLGSGGGADHFTPRSGGCAVGCVGNAGGGAIICRIQSINQVSGTRRLERDSGRVSLDFCDTDHVGPGAVGLAITQSTRSRLSGRYGDLCDNESFVYGSWSGAGGRDRVSADRFSPVGMVDNNRVSFFLGVTCDLGLGRCWCCGLQCHLHGPA